MSEILPSPQHGFRNKHIQKALKVDMTPMVDLGFLLITFFIITTNLAEQKSTSLVMPADGPPMKLPAIGKKADMMLLIKPADEATYQNMMDALDEVQINNIKHYAIVPPDKEELHFITNSKL